MAKKNQNKLSSDQFEMTEDGQLVIDNNGFQNVLESAKPTDAQNRGAIVVVVGVGTK